MSDIDAMFGGMAKAPIFGRGNYMKEGNFLVEITNVFVKPRFKGGNVFVAEFKILTSDNPEQKVGGSGSWVPKIETPNTFGDIKSLIFAATGVDPKKVSNDDEAAHADVTRMAKAACGSPTAIKELEAKGVPADFMVGLQVKLECNIVKTRANTDFTRYTWSPAEAS
jgi:hypothetical protein